MLTNIKKYIIINSIQFLNYTFGDAKKITKGEVIPMNYKTTTAIPVTRGEYYLAPKQLEELKNRNLTLLESNKERRIDFQILSSPVANKEILIRIY